MGLAAAWGAGFVCGWSGLLEKNAAEFVAQTAAERVAQRLMRAQVTVLQRERDATFARRRVLAQPTLEHDRPCAKGALERRAQRRIGRLTGGAGRQQT